MSSHDPEPSNLDESIPSTEQEESTSNQLVPHHDSLAPAEAHAPRVLYSPPIDIYETDEGLVLVADLPGVKTETLDLQVQNKNLTLFGRVEDYTPKDGVPIHQEYGVGDFLRSFILTDEVDHERISAKLSHGVLKVILPKVQRTEPRKISIDEGE